MAFNFSLFSVIIIMSSILYIASCSLFYLPTSHFTLLCFSSYIFVKSSSSSPHHILLLCHLLLVLLLLFFLSSSPCFPTSSSAYFSSLFTFFSLSFFIIFSFLFFIFLLFSIFLNIFQHTITTFSFFYPPCSDISLLLPLLPFFLMGRESKLFRS